MQKQLTGYWMQLSQTAQRNYTGTKAAMQSTDKGKITRLRKSLDYVFIARIDCKGNTSQQNYLSRMETVHVFSRQGNA